MTTQARSDSMTYYGDLWWVVLLQGIILIILGLWLLASPGISVSVLLWLLGIYWLVNGTLHVIEGIVGNTGRSRGWLLFSGVVGILAGLVAVNNPFFSALIAGLSVVIVIAFMVTIEGVANVVRFTQGAGGGALVLGILSLLFGLFLLFNPTGGIIALPYILGFFAVLGGIAMLFGSFSLRSLATQ